ncbi:MAG: hypothetical protein H0V17_11415 [Deltaproteobacteria bacterium]|nr:hypothetical protein [Deltaproteobacteria bacterium]
MRALLGIASLTLAGCAQLLGLEQTTFSPGDAIPDATSVCDGLPAACVATTGRSICGQLFGTGATADVPLRVTDPTGATCDAANIEGPCGVQVTALPMASFFDGVATGEVTGQIDDCGRFTVLDVDPAIPEVAVRFSDLALTLQPSATLVRNRVPTIGIDQDIAGYAVLLTTTQEWATQLGVSPDNTSSGYLVRYTAQGISLPNEAVAVDSGSALTNPAGTIPWAAYFGASAFGAIEVGAMVTSTSGTALAVLPAGPFSLEGFRQGRRCGIMGLRSVANTLIHVIEVDC